MIKNELHKRKLGYRDTHLKYLEALGLKNDQNLDGRINTSEKKYLNIDSTLKSFDMHLVIFQFEYHYIMKITIKATIQLLHFKGLIDKFENAGDLNENLTFFKKLEGRCWAFLGRRSHSLNFLPKEFLNDTATSKIKIQEA